MRAVNPSFLDSSKISMHFSEILEKENVKELKERKIKSKMKSDTFPSDSIPDPSLLDSSLFFP